MTGSGRKGRDSKFSEASARLSSFLLPGAAMSVLRSSFLLGRAQACPTYPANFALSPPLVTQSPRAEFYDSDDDSSYATRRNVSYGVFGTTGQGVQVYNYDHSDGRSITKVVRRRAVQCLLFLLFSKHCRHIQFQVDKRVSLKTSKI